MGASVGGGKRLKKHRRFTEINVTPFVDVMLVLLIIFMVTAPMLTTGVNVDLPETSAAALPGQDEPLSVSIRNNGEVYIQDTKVTVDKLGQKLRAITGEKRDTRIFVRGDARVDYGHIMQVVGEINAAGYTKVALVTAQAKSASGPER